MDKTKNFKSIKIHNGCRNPKMKIVHSVKKTTLCQRIQKCALMHIQDLIDLNLSLIDAETLKASLYGKEYLKTLEYAIIKLNIDLNDVRIEFHKSFLNLFIKLATKLKLL